MVQNSDIRVEAVIQLKNGEANDWNNVILQQGEPGYDTENKVLKIGDGKNPWKELPPIGKDTKYGLSYDANNHNIKLVVNGTQESIDVSELFDNIITNVELVNGNTLKFTWEDGSSTEVNLQTFLDIYTGENTDTISVNVENNKISASLQDGAIQKQYLSEDVNNLMVRNWRTCSELGLDLTDENNNNLQLLADAINAGYEIIVDNMYNLHQIPHETGQGYTNPESLASEDGEQYYNSSVLTYINKDIILKGKTKDCGFKLQFEENNKIDGKHALFGIFKGCNNITISNLQFKYNNKYKGEDFEDENLISQFAFPYILEVDGEDKTRYQEMDSWLTENINNFEDDAATTLKGAQDTLHTKKQVQDAFKNDYISLFYSPTIYNYKYDADSKAWTSIPSYTRKCENLPFLNKVEIIDSIFDGNISAFNYEGVNVYKTNPEVYSANVDVFHDDSKVYCSTLQITKNVDESNNPSFNIINLFNNSELSLYRINGNLIEITEQINGKGTTIDTEENGVYYTIDLSQTILIQQQVEELSENQMYGVNKLNVKRNKVSNFYSKEFIKITAPLTQSAIKYNEVANFGNTFYYNGCTNTHKYQVKHKGTDDIGYNKAICNYINPNAFGPFSQTDNSITHYYNFALVENRKVTYHDNHVEGMIMKASPITTPQVVEINTELKQVQITDGTKQINLFNQDGELYDFYTTSEYVTYYNNIWKNIVKTGQTTSSRWQLIQAKGVLNEQFENGTRDYFNNQFIIEEQFVRDNIILKMPEYNDDFKVLFDAEIENKSPAEITTEDVSTNSTTGITYSYSRKYKNQSLWLENEIGEIIKTRIKSSHITPGISAVLRFCNSKFGSSIGISKANSQFLKDCQLAIIYDYFYDQFKEEEKDRHQELKSLVSTLRKNNSQDNTAAKLDISSSLNTYYTTNDNKDILFDLFVKKHMPRLILTTTQQKYIKIENNFFDMLSLQGVSGDPCASLFYFNNNQMNIHYGIKHGLFHYGDFFRASENGSYVYDPTTGTVKRGNRKVVINNNTIKLDSVILGTSYFSDNQENYAYNDIGTEYNGVIRGASLAPEEFRLENNYIAYPGQMNLIQGSSTVQQKAQNYIVNNNYIIALSPLQYHTDHQNNQVFTHFAGTMSNNIITGQVDRLFAIQTTPGETNLRFKIKNLQKTQNPATLYVYKDRLDQILAAGTYVGYLKIEVFINNPALLDNVLAKKLYQFTVEKNTTNTQITITTTTKDDENNNLISMSETDTYYTFDVNLNTEILDGEIIITSSPFTPK